MAVSTVRRDADAAKGAKHVDQNSDVARPTAGTCRGGGEQGHGHSHRGGQEVRIGSYEVELVVAGSEMTLHVNDTKDQKVDAAGFSATAIVLAKGNQQRTVELAHGGDNKLVGKIDFATDTRFRATVTLRNAEG